MTALPDPPAWPGDHAAVRALWPLRAGVAYVNHGAFGATPRPVLDEQQRWRERLESQPFDFLMRTLPDAVEHSRAVVAEFLGADPAGLAFVSNATTGVATVLRSLRTAPATGWS